MALGNLSAADIRAACLTMAAEADGVPTAGGTLTINGVALGSFDYRVVSGNQTVAAFLNSDWFTATADSRSAFVIVKGNLTINAGQIFKPANRKLFTVVYVDGTLTVNGELSMTQRGANHSASGSNLAAGDILIYTGTASGSTNPMVPAAGAAGAAGGVITGATGTAGTAGQTGGGGQGGSNIVEGGRGAAGTSFSGGSGGGGQYSNTPPAPNFAPGGPAGGPGGAGYTDSYAASGGAGNPGGASINAGVAGSGTGGTLIVLVTGPYQGSGSVTAAGAQGGQYTTTNGGAGAGSGGGSITILAASLGGPTPTALGGPAYTGMGATISGGGGNGSVRTLVLSAAALAGTTAFGVSATAALLAPVTFATAPAVRFSTNAIFNAAAFAATPSVGVWAFGLLTAPTNFTAASTIRLSTVATFAVARFVSTPIVHFGTVATLRTGTEKQHASSVRILLAGVDARTRIAGLTIRDVLNDAPNSCTLTIDGSEAPTCEQTVRVVLGIDDPRLLFNGALQTVDTSYAGRPVPRLREYPCTATDDTTRANRMRPFGTWVNVSATIYAQQLMTRFVPGFTTVHVQPNLPPVTITLDGTEGLSAALKQAATQIGGYFYFEDGDLHLFLEETTDTPDPIDGTPCRLLNEPPIRISRDDSQLRTRQCGRAHGEPLLADVAAGETILPVANVTAWFNTPGSERRAIALAQRLTYTGIQDAGGGSLVGPGASPVVAPNVVAVVGAGLPNGVLQYAVSFVTAAGESLVGPFAVITAGPVTGAAIPNPTTAPGFNAAGVGAGVDAGGHSYAVSWLTATGETLPGPVGAITVGAVSTPVTPPATAPTLVEVAGAEYWAQNDRISVAVTFVTGNGETTIGPAGAVTITRPMPTSQINVSNIPIGPPGTVARRLYRVQVNGTVPTGNIFVVTISDNTTTTLINLPAGSQYSSFGQNGPPSNTAGNYPLDYHVIPLVGLPSGPAGVTGKNVYRTASGGGPLRLLPGMPLSNGTTTYTDTAADAALGAAAPAANTTAVTQNFNAANLTGIAQGPGTVTARRIYRTAANGSQLKLLKTIADNSTTTTTDTAADGTLGANPPVSDTSGLVGTGVAGAVLPGATSLLTSGAGPFPTTGWALLTGNQLIRYTGITGNTLTGIPASGVGSLVTTVLYGTQVLPAPALIGVVGITVPIVKGTPVNVWVQRDDSGAQAEQAIVDAANGIVPADGIYEGPPLIDERRNEASMRALCDATLALYSRPIVTVTYDCRDVKTKSGRTIVIDLDEPSIHEVLTIQEVTITEIDIAPGLLPRFSVVASSTRFSLDDIVRRLLTATDSVTSA